MVQFTGFQNIYDYLGIADSKYQQYCGGILRLWKTANNYWDFDWTTDAKANMSYQFFYVPEGVELTGTDEFSDMMGTMELKTDPDTMLPYIIKPPADPKNVKPCMCFFQPLTLHNRAG